MTTEPLASTLTDLDAARSHVVRIARNGQVWSVSVPMQQAEAQVLKASLEQRREARLKTSKDPYDKMPTRYFICRIVFEEV